MYDSEDACVTRTITMSMRRNITRSTTKRARIISQVGVTLLKAHHDAGKHLDEHHEEHAEENHDEDHDAHHEEGAHH